MNHNKKKKNYINLIIIFTIQIGFSHSFYFTKQLNPKTKTQPELDPLVVVGKKGKTKMAASQTVARCKHSFRDPIIQ